MSITLEKINRRLFQLNLSSGSNQVKNLSGIRLLDESNNIFFENNALNLIKNWEGLDIDIDRAFETSLETYDLLLKYGSKNAINKATDILIEGTNKLRNASELKRSLKVRLGRLKKGTKISKNIDIDSSTNNIQKAMDNIKNALGSATANIVKNDEPDYLEENYNRIIDKVSEVAEIDRIVKQYSNIHKRFNIDRLFSECGADRESIYNTIYETAKYIDTFNSPFKNKYNATLESAWYALQKYHIVCENSTIINTVTDYYLFNDFIPDMISFAEETAVLANISPIFNKKDFSCLDYISESNIKQFNVNKELDYRKVVENYMLDGKLKEIVSYEDQEQQSIEKSDRDDNIIDFIKDFRKRCAEEENPSNFITFKALIDQILNHQKSQIIFNVSSIFNLLSVVFLNNEDHDIKAIIKIVDDITDTVLELPLKETQANEILNTYKSQVDTLSKKENINAREQIYLDTVEVNAGKIENFIKDNFTEEQEEDENASDDELTEAAEIVLIANLLDSLTEGGTIDPDIPVIINGNVAKFTNDTLDALTDFSVTVPKILDKDSLKECFINYRNELRKNQAKKSVEDYMKIDCLTNNIARLNEDATIYSTHNNTRACIGYLMCMNEIKNFHTDINNEIYFTEAMSFSNKLKLAVNNLKRAAINLSSKEKSASNAIDAAINSIARNMDKEMSAEDRERVVRGSILPSATKCIKLALMFAAVGKFIDPAVAVIGALGMFFSRKKAQKRERQLALDEIEIELKMCERYLRMYEDQQDMDKIRKVEIIQRNLQRQRQRIKYKMAVDFKQASTASIEDPY